MPKVKLNPTFDEFRGSVNNLTYRKSFGRTFASVKVDRSNIQPSEAQTAHHERFRKATRYGKMALANPETRQAYKQASKEKGMPLFALTVADFFNAPSIDDMDLSAYYGQANDVIMIEATDDFGVVNVHVNITDNQTDEVIESGNAIETAPASGLWLYTATTTAPAGINVRVSVVATDRPGGTAVDTRVKTV